MMLRTVRRDDAVGIASVSFRDNTPAGTRVVQLADPAMRINLYALYRASSEKAPAVAKLVALVSDAVRGVEA